MQQRKPIQRILALQCLVAHDRRLRLPRKRAKRPLPNRCCLWPSKSPRLDTDLPVSYRHRVDRYRNSRPRDRPFFRPIAKNQLSDGIDVATAKFPTSALAKRGRSPRQMTAIKKRMEPGWIVLIGPYDAIVRTKAATATHGQRYGVTDREATRRTVPKKSHCAGPPFVLCGELRTLLLMGQIRGCSIPLRW